MGQAGGDATVSAPAATPPGGQDIQALLHSTLSLRGDHPLAGVDPDKLSLDGLPKLTPIKPNPVPSEGAHLPPVSISQPGDAGPPQIPGRPPANPNDDTESRASKIGREVVVVGGGLGRSALYELASLGDKIPQLGTSVAIGATLSGFAKTSELGATGVLLLGTYFTSRYIVNALNDKERWDALGGAVTDAWHSNKNTWQDLKTVSDTGGNFVADTALSYGAAYLGYNNKALAEAILGALRLPVPMPGVGAKMPLSPQLMNTSMVLAVAPIPGLYKNHYVPYQKAERAISAHDTEHDHADQK